MRTTLAGTFRSLSVRNFRLFAAGQVLSVGGTWMMVVAQDWLVLALTGDSAAALGAVTALQFTPRAPAHPVRGAGSPTGTTNACC
ncbi:hypothetical protein GCM10020254_02110 [Streptomyces goshikiensis]